MENIHDLLEGFEGAYVPPAGGPNARPSDWVPPTKSGEAGPSSSTGAGAAGGAVAGAGAGGKKVDPKGKGAAPAAAGGRNLFGAAPGADEKKGKAKIKENAPREVHHDSDGNTWVDNMHEIELENVEQAMELVQYATKKRYASLHLHSEDTVSRGASVVLFRDVLSLYAITHWTDNVG